VVKAAVEKVTIGEPQANTKKDMFTTNNAKDTKGMSNINSENFVLLSLKFALFVQIF
jgi:hypothetical protein